MGTSKSFDDEVLGALADIASSLQAGNDAQSEASTALVEIVEVLKAKRDNKPMDGLIAAIKGLRIKASDVTVNVSPTPLTITPVLQVLDRPAPVGFTVKHVYDNHDRILESVVTPIAKRI